MSGAVCIAPSYLPEFAGVHCLLYDNEAHLKEMVEMIATQDIATFAAGVHQLSVEQLRKDYALSKINNSRRVVLDILAERAAVEHTGDPG